MALNHLDEVAAVVGEPLDVAPRMSAAVMNVWRVA